MLGLTGLRMVQTGGLSLPLSVMGSLFFRGIIFFSVSLNLFFPSNFCKVHSLRSGKVEMCLCAYVPMCACHTFTPYVKASKN